MKHVGVLPTLVTLGNGYAGLLAIFKIAEASPGDPSGLYAAGWLVLLAMLFDVLDGKIARMAGSTSVFGAHLDSLCDAISFGVAPAFLAKASAEVFWSGHYNSKILTFLAAIYAIGVIIRLARYNVEHTVGEGRDDQTAPTSFFDGMPSPGAAGVVAALVVLTLDPGSLLDYRPVMLALPAVAFVLGFLMVSRIPYVHFGNRFLRGRRSFVYIFVVVVLLALITKFPHEFLAVGFVLYALSGPLLAPLVRRGVIGRAPGEDEDENEDAPPFRMIGS